jgi:hypothetical protein
VIEVSLVLYSKQHAFLDVSPQKIIGKPFPNKTLKLNMCNCKKCGTEFKVPSDAIEMVFAIYCKPCIKKSLKKMAKMPQKRFLEMQAKELAVRKNQSGNRFPIKH